ncbi:MAG: PLP-dependent transferase [Gemmatimonadota bacterium]|nr:PLP-dependent transferase [Gemmatimonadota bacterium]
MAEQDPQTRSIRLQAERSPHKEHAVPVFVTSSFVFDDAEEMRAAFADEIERPIYSRFSNPNVREFVDRMCVLEGAESGFAMASGMAAVFGTFGALCSAGDHIVSCRAVFGATHTLFTKILPRFGITHTYVDVDDTDSWAKALRKNSRLLYVETPTNPGIDVVDLAWLGEFARAHELILVVDNCLATPVISRPIGYGADLSLHSGTKYIDGQGRVVGGVVVGKRKLIDDIYWFCRNTGPALSPFNAWLLSRSLETLELRMERHSENALELARRLEARADVEDVMYPLLPSHPRYEIAKQQMRWGGGILAFKAAGGIEQGRRFLDRLRMCSLTANLGDTRTIATHPASTTHARMSEEERLAVGITPGLVRISVGLESAADIVADIEQALDRSK